MEKIRKYGGLAVIILSVVLICACGGGSSVRQYDGSTGGGVEFTNEYSSPAELGVGDIMYVNFGDSPSATVDFTGVDSSAKFMLVLGSANEGGSSTVMSLSSDLSAMVEKDVSTEIAAGEEYSAEEVLSAWLRAAEFDIAATEPVPVSGVGGMKAMSAAKAVGIGDVESFRVLSNLSSTTIYTIIDASVRCVGNSVVFYVDVDPRITSSILSDADINTLCNEFDGVASGEQQLFGATSDVNQDEKTAILMTPQINNLGLMGGGIITGYFWAGDLYEQTSSNPVSNFREIIYTMVPDPDGTFGTRVSKEFTLTNLLPAVLPHELQHAINYNQHVFESGSPPEQNWLNEGLSHLAEDLMGYGQENPSRFALYLSNPSYAGVVTMRQPNLYERGASYLFLRYLYEQASSGDDFVRSLETSGMTGVDNVERAFGGASGFSRFHEFLGRWTAALAMTDEGLTMDHRYIYNARVRSSQTGNWEGVCLKCDADDGRGTVLSGVAKSTYYGAASATIAASGAKFYEIPTVPTHITIDGSSGSANFGVLIRQQ